MDNRRLLIAFLLSFAVIWGFRLLNPPQPVTPQAPPVAEAPPSPIAPVPAVTPALGTGAETPAEIRAEAPSDETVETDLYTAVVSNVGGVLKSFRLKKYLNVEKEPLELINAVVANTVGWPLALDTGDAALNKLISSANYQIRRDDKTVIVEFAAEGVHVRKTMVFDDTKYVVRIISAVERGGTPIPHELVLQGGFGDQSIQPPDPSRQQAIYGNGADFTRVLLSGIEEPQQVTASVLGAEDQYFLAAFLMPADGPGKVSKSDYRLPDGTDARALYVAIPSTQPVDIYIGPKESASLASADARLSGVPDYGWFGFFTKPLIAALRLIHSFVGNYGWAIVILTLVINIAMFPLRIKQQVSMQKMQKLAPQMRSLQDKYKKLKAGDPKRAEVEAELMKMNKEQMAGCLPSLLQMPLLFAFWSMLSVSIELRQAPWLLWIQDLSRHDPYYILPILMGVSMFVQQKMTPTTMDPAQAKIMMLMPLILLMFLLWAQSGVTLYWLTSNVIGIGQQWVIRKYWSEEEVLKPAARQRKPEAG